MKKLKKQFDLSPTLVAEIEKIAVENFNAPIHHVTGKVVITPTVVKLLEIGINQIKNQELSDYKVPENDLNFAIKHLSIKQNCNTENLYELTEDTKNLFNLFFDLTGRIEVLESELKAIGSNLKPRQDKDRINPSSNPTTTLVENNPSSQPSTTLLEDNPSSNPTTTLVEDNPSSQPSTTLVEDKNFKKDLQIEDPLVSSSNAEMLIFTDYKLSKIIGLSNNTLKNIRSGITQLENCKPVTRKKLEKYEITNDGKRWKHKS